MFTHNTHDIILARYLALTMGSDLLCEGCEGRVQSGIRNVPRICRVYLLFSLSVSYVCVYCSPISAGIACVNKASEPIMIEIIFIWVSHLETIQNWVNP